MSSRDKSVKEVKGKKIGMQRGMPATPMGMTTQLSARVLGLLTNGMAMSKVEPAGANTSK